MTLKDLEETLGIPRGVALRLARMIPGAKKEPAGPGQIPRWVLPGDAVEHVSEEMLQAARAEPSDTRAAPPSDPALVEEERAVRRTRLAADQARAESDRLRAEADRLKAEEELTRLRDRRGSPAESAFSGLGDRLESHLERLERALDDRARPDPTAALAEIVKDVLTPLVEKAVAPPPPPVSAPNITEVMGMIEKLRTLAGPPDEHLGEIRAAYLEGLEDGHARATAQAGEGGSVWSDLLRPLLPDVIELLKRGQLLRPAVAVPAGAGAPPRAVPPSAPPTQGPQPSPSPTPTGAVTPSAAETLPPEVQAAVPSVFLLLKQAIGKASEEFDLYATLADEHLPGFLDDWIRLDQVQALASLGQVDPFFASPAAVDWLKRWWQFLKEEYLVGGPEGASQ